MDSPQGLEIYTDGAFSHSRKTGGIGIAYKFSDGRSYSFSKQIKAPTTNNRCELLAVIHALHSISKPIEQITVYSDSQYVLGCINEGWKKEKNSDLWNVYDIIKERADKYCDDIVFKWVKGHESDSSDHTKFNNIADKLAVSASLEI